MVLLLHIIAFGGILGNCEKGSLQYYITMIIYIACFSAVNCFGLISGYLMYNHKYKSARTISLWLQVVFYGIVAVMVAAIFAPDSFNIRAIVSSVLPVTHNLYWYISAYIAMCCFIPFMNKLIELLSKKEMTILVITTIFLFCGVNLISDSFSLANGYGVLWLISLYFVGAYIHKYDIGKNIKWWVLLLCVFGSIILTGVSQPIIEKIRIPIASDIFIKYTSPTVLLTAISLLLFFSRCRFPKPVNKIFGLFGTCSLAAFIIHSLPQVRTYLFVDRFAFLLKFPLPVFVLLVLVIALGIFLLCSAIEKIRLALFKLIHISALTDKLGAAIDEKLYDHPSINHGKKETGEPD